jgi:WS/DGAT/MGAT family acyltransferase
MATGSLERMSSVDTAWLRMDRPGNRMMVVGVMLLDAPVDYRLLRRTLEARFASIPRFRQYPRLNLTGAWWQADEQFDIDRHLYRVRLRGRRGPVELQRQVGRLASTALSRSKPLWEFHLVENYLDGCAVIVRIHHCYADGIALVGVLLSLTDAARHGARAASRSPPAADSGPHDGIWQLLGPLADIASSAAWLSQNVVARYFDLLRHPTHAVDYAKLAGRIAGDVLELATMPTDSATRFKGEVDAVKRVAWCEPIPLDEIKAVSRVLGCTVNDVLLACVSGALGRYLAAHGDDPSGVEIRALVPVNLRRQADDGRLGNWFGLVPLVLPLGIDNPLARVYEIHRRMEELKASYLAPISLGLLAFAGLVPAALQQEILDFLANKATAVMTNLPGPQQPLYLAGSRLTQLMFWVPQSGSIGMGVSILSFAGGVQFGLITDAGLTPDPQLVVAGFGPEFERLLTLVLMEPWDARRDPALVEKELAAVLRPRRAQRSRLTRAALDPRPLRTGKPAAT